MNKYLLVLLILVFVLSACISAETCTATYYVTSMNEDVSPSSIVVLDQDTTMTGLGHYGEWREVETPSGVTGYVHSSYCQ